jgi:uncharacterized membrane-anchored protein YjiN (DUF445 family)
LRRREEMANNPVSASLSIDAKYIETEVQRIVKAAIVETLGNKDEIIRKAIDSTIDQYVDERGEPCKKDSYRARPFLDYVAQKTVEKTVREAIEETVNENKEEFKAEIKKQIGKRKWKEDIAQSFVQLILDDVKSDWKMPVSISLQKPKEY